MKNYKHTNLVLTAKDSDYIYRGVSYVFEISGRNSPRGKCPEG